jgi:hypothetical protein
LDILKQADRIDVIRYGFIIKDGSKDIVGSEAHLKVIENGITKEIVLSSCEKQKKSKRWITLDNVKTEAEAISMLFDMAFK